MKLKHLKQYNTVINRKKIDIIQNTKINHVFGRISKGANDFHQSKA